MIRVSHPFRQGYDLSRLDIANHNLAEKLEFSETKKAGGEAAAAFFCDLLIYIYCKKKRSIWLWNDVHVQYGAYNDILIIYRF